ncbi:MAG: serine hydroxymethyltransferase [Alphaproteobacteria bacterium]|nr:serine hydroxymethyltransferase [Alphaproteobacteria bacterium]
MTNDFFIDDIENSDSEIFSVLEKELDRQQNQIELIASENIVSRAVLQVQGSVLTNKYAEGYPGKRYYSGCEFVDISEQIAIDRVCKLFGVKFANVQPHSGSQANQSVMLALLKPGDTVLGQTLASGGHLTHGAKPNLSGKWFNVLQYGVRKEDALIDYDEVEKLAHEHKPKLIIAGASAYSRHIDFARFRKIADAVGAFLMVDMAHYAGLVAAGLYQSPIPYAHITTSTTHKTLRGPRGGLVLTDDEEIIKKINSAVFPGLQGGPLEHVIAAKAVAFGEALQPSFKLYAKKVLENARTLAATLKEGGLDIVSGGTDCHLLLVDLRPKKLTGQMAENSMNRSRMACNKNSIPFDPEKPMVTSGLRLGTPAATTRGFGTKEFEEIGQNIIEVLDGLSKNGEDNNTSIENEISKRVIDLCRRFPIYPLV